MPANLEYRARERQRKRESRRQASETQGGKDRQRSGARDKKQRRLLFYVPVFLKQSEVVPVPNVRHLKVVEQDPRPISLTPHIAKVIEGLTLDSLFKQVCDKLDSHQFALAGKSATDALVFFIQVIFEALDQGDTYARILFTDFTKGFDLVDHNILIQEMELLGVHEATIR